MKVHKLLITILLVLVTSATATHFVNANRNTTTVLMTAGGFEPKNITIRQGDTIIFQNNDSENRWPASNIHPTHEIYPEFDPKTGIAPGKSWQFTFTKAGRWQYHDHLIPTLSGSVTVTPAQEVQKPQPGFWHRLWQTISSWWHRLWHKDVSIARGKPSTSFDETISINDESVFSDEKRLESYMHKFGPKQTIAQLHLLEGKFGSCHQSAHRAGHIGYQQLGDHALIEYSPECQSGYYHGVMEAYFKDHGTSNLAESMQNLCPAGLNNFFEHQCIHGIGHGLLAWTNYELPEALAACDQLPRRQDSCWTGAFMENLSAQIATGNKNSSAPATDIHLTKYLKDDDSLYPCNGVPEKYQNSCYFLQTSRMVQIFGADFKKVAAACSTAPTMYQASCFGSMGRDVGGTHPKNNSSQIAECSFVTNPTNRLHCLNGAVQNSFWDPSGQDLAIDFCSVLKNENEKHGCYNTIFERATQLFTTNVEKITFCEKVEPLHKNKCRFILLNER